MFENFCVGKNLKTVKFKQWTFNEWPSWRNWVNYWHWRRAALQKPIPKQDSSRRSLTSCQRWGKTIIIKAGLNRRGISDRNSTSLPDGFTFRRDEGKSEQTDLYKANCAADTAVRTALIVTITTNCGGKNSWFSAMGNWAAGRRVTFRREEGETGGTWETVFVEWPGLWDYRSGHMIWQKHVL